MEDLPKPHVNRQNLFHVVCSQNIGLVWIMVWIPEYPLDTHN